MAYGHFIILCAFLLVHLICITESHGKKTGLETVRGRYGRGRTFKYVIQNEFVKPVFLETINLKFRRRQNLIKYMQTAVLEKPDQFKNFSATFSSPYGYFIDQINGVRGNWKEDKTFWIILNSTGHIPVGVSSYIPIAGETITFNFTNKWPSSDTTHT